MVAITAVITVTVLAMGYFDSPEYNSDNSLPSYENFVPLKAETGKIDINSATIEELMSLEQIGKVRAKEIIDYREENGGFYSVEEILSIDKIPQSVYLKIKDKITLGVYNDNEF